MGCSQKFRSFSTMPDMDNGNFDLYWDSFIPHIAFLALRVEIVELESELPVGLVDFVVLCVAARIRGVASHLKPNAVFAASRILRVLGLRGEEGDCCQRNESGYDSFHSKEDYFDSGVVHCLVIFGLSLLTAAKIQLLF